MKKLYLLVLFSFFICKNLVAQESIIKDFAEPILTNKWMNPICLYASTLRMVNISGNTHYNKLVNDIEKILIYTLDSTMFSTKEYKMLLKEYKAIGYGEYVKMGGKQEIKILGKADEYVGVIASKSQTMVFYLRGEINFGEIPSLLQSFQNENLHPIITNMFK